MPLRNPRLASRLDTAASTLETPTRATVAAAFAALAVVSIGFGTWLKTQQLAIVSPALWRAYPRLWFAEDVLVVVLGLALLSVALVAFSARLVPRARLRQYLVITALGLAALELVALGFRPSRAIGVLIAGQLAVLIVTAARSLDASPRFRRHSLALLAIFVCHMAFNAFASPASWRNPIDANKNEFPLALPLFNAQFTNAKLLTLADRDHAYWGSTPRSFAMYSLALPLAAASLDVPSVDVESYARLLLAVVFLLGVAGCFGFYLFLNVGLDFTLLTSLVGAGLFYFGNAFFVCTLVGPDYLAFVSVYLLLPYALVAAKLAHREDSRAFAMAAGLAIAAPLYLFAPHPDAVIHGYFVFGCYLGFLTLFGGGRASFVRRLELTGWAVAVAAGACVAYLAPLIAPVLARESFMLGHGGSGYIFPYGAGSFGLVFHNVLWPLLECVGIFVLLAVTEGANLVRHTPSRRDVLFFLALLAALAWLVVAGNDGIFAKLILRVTDRVAFLSTWNRLPMYLVLAALIVGLAGFDAIVRSGRATLATRIGLGLAVIAGVAGVALVPPSACWMAAVLIVLFGPLRPWIAGGDGVDPWRGWISGVAFLCCTIPFLPGVRSLAPRYSLVYDASLTPFANPYADNGEKQVYVTLQAALANYPNLKGDSANAAFFRRRLVAFERDSMGSPEARAYRAALHEQKAGSAARLDDGEVVDLAKKTYPQVDAFYTQTLHMLPYTSYNFSSYLVGLAPFERVMATTPAASAAMAGIGNGVLPVNTGSATIDTRYAATTPLLESLYIVPNATFITQRQDWVPWAVATSSVLNESTRKLLDIAGVDDFLVPGADYASLSPSQAAGLENVTPAAPAVSTLGSFVLLRNLRSYGLAYFATGIRYVDPSLAARFVNDFVFPVPPASSAAVSREIDGLRAVLAGLGGKWDVVLEDAARARTVGEETRSAGSHVRLEGLAGNRAAFAAVCDDPSCTFVYNMAAISGWHGWVDANEATVRPANFAFLSVEVPEGQHTVWFEYRPWYAFAATMVSLLTAIAALLFLVSAPALADVAGA